jgi:murein DD-endopeptidase MepM/ murein hydrolase activator NlpD
VKAALVAFGAAAAVLLALVGGGLLLALGMVGTAPSQVGTSGQARTDIPPGALLDYQAAAQTCPGLDWTVLAGIGKVESDHDRSQLPGVHSGQNAAGAAGPMQFLPATWAAFHLPGMDDVYDLRDAVFAAAHYLCTNGAGMAGRLRQAIWLYNHDWGYVDQVLSWAAAYAGDALQAMASGLGLPGDPFARACRPVVTQPYGPTANPLEPIIGGRRFHTGVDLACPEGTPVHSLTDGVTHVTVGWGGGYGDNVVVEVETRLPGDMIAWRYFVRYAHLDTVTVAEGAVVHGGDIVGREGSTGNSTGPHLHFEVDRGAALATSSVDPSPLLEVS